MRSPNYMKSQNVYLFSASQKNMKVCSLASPISRLNSEKNFNQSRHSHKVVRVKSSMYRVSHDSLISFKNKKTPNETFGSKKENQA